jgi:enoyl-CoA hydratase/carnithine racemase
MTDVQTNQLSIDRSRPSIWTVSISNPPINMLDEQTIQELHGLMPLIEQEESLKVVIFESADPDFFFAHYDTSRATQSSGKTGLIGDRPWTDFVLRLGRAPVVSIAKVAGRARGVGNEFILACDLRFASKEKAIFGQPEVGVGLIPGGGSVEWLPRLVGRSRAVEIILSADDAAGGALVVSRP